MTAITDVRDISKIAYGFMGTQALVAALDIDLFGHLAGKTATVDELASRTHTKAEPLAMLLVTLQSLGLVTRDGERYGNAPASEKYLVPDAPQFFGEYIRLQVGKQIYPHALKIGQGLTGNPAKLYEEMAADPEEAAAFSHSQHVGSLGPAYLLSRKLNLDGRRKLLDVAGGSGAFSIKLCESSPDLHATIVDFPAVIPVARRYVSQAGLDERVHYVEDNALDCQWPGDQDIVLMSYLLSAMGKRDLAALFSKAHAALNPGGILVVHDFMVNDDLAGPLSAALWMLVVLSASDPVPLTIQLLTSLAEEKGFTVVVAEDLVPTITKYLVARKG